MKRSYLIEVDEIDGKIHISKTNDGFNPLELIGILQFLEGDIKDQMRGRIHPEKITRHLVKNTSGKLSKCGKDLQEGDRVKIWLPDDIEPEGGSYWYATISYYRGKWRFLQDGFDYSKSEEDEITDINEHPSKIIELNN